MKEFLVKIERVTLKGEPKKKMSQRGEPYTAYSYDVEISAGDDMFLIDKFIMVKEGNTIDEIDIQISHVSTSHPPWYQGV